MADMKLPFSAVEELLVNDEHSAELMQYVSVDMGERRPLPSAVARRLGVDVNTVHRYRKHGVSHNIADRIAIQLGLHPAEIWPNYYEEYEPCSA